VATIVASRRSDRRIVGIAAGLLAVPVLVLLVRAARATWVPSSDWAAIEARTRDVWTSHTSLVGPYSRYGWNHPGPLLFYVLAVPYRLLGGQPHGLFVGALAINAAAFTCIGVILWRRGRIPGLAIGLVVVLLVTRALGVGFFLDPWNPYVIVLPLFAVVLLAWDATAGDLWALPVAIGIGSFVVQSHVGTTLAVAAPIGVAAAGVLVDARREGFARLKPVALAALAVLAVCWSPPVVEQFQPGGGNLGRLVHFWMQPHPSTTGWSEGARIVAQQLAVPAPWITGHERVSPFTGAVDPRWHVPVSLILLVTASAVAWRRRDRQSLTLDVMALVLIAAAVFSAAHIVDTPFDYIVRWMWIVGATSWLAIIWTLWRALFSEAPANRIPARSGIAVVTLLAVGFTVVAVHAGLPVRPMDRSLSRMAPTARSALRGLRGPILIEHEDNLPAAAAATGMLLIAMHAGIDAKLASAEANEVGSSHTISEPSARNVVVVAVDAVIDRYLHDPSYRSLVLYDPLSTGEREDVTAIEAEARRAYSAGFATLKRWSEVHRGDVTRATGLDKRGPRIELFLDTAQSDVTGDRFERPSPNA
jgi:hypothetical protein